MSKIIDYAKAHPWATGIIVVVGGIIFILIVRGGGGSSSSGASGPAGPSDAEVVANAQIAAATIGANAATAQASTQAGAAVSAAQIGAGVQLNSDNKAAEVAMRALEVQEYGINRGSVVDLANIAAGRDVALTDSNNATKTNLAGIGAQRDVGLATVKGQTDAVLAQLNNQQALAISNNAIRSQVVTAAGSKNATNSKVASVLASVATNQPVSYVMPSQPNYGNSAAGIIGAVGNAAGSILPFFSDERVKENIVHDGFDKKGRDMFKFNYRGSDKVRRGRIAQMVERSEPRKVTQDIKTGYKKIQVDSIEDILPPALLSFFGGIANV